jgi:hypothetical protein
MARRKVTFVYDPGKVETPWEQCMGHFCGVDPLSVTGEDLPDPPLRQRLVMEIESDPDLGAFDPSGWESDLRQRCSYLPHNFKDGRRRILSFKVVPDA